MRIQGQLVEDDYAAAQFLHMRPSLPNAIVAAVLVIGVLAMIAFDHSKASFGALGALIFIAAIVFVYTPWRARRTFREYKALSEPVSYEIREDGLHAKRTHGEGLVQWSELLRWKKNQRLILLYPAKNIFYMIPRRFFENVDQFESFLMLVGSKLGKAARS